MPSVQVAASTRIVVPLTLASEQMPLRALQFDLEYDSSVLQIDLSQPDALSAAQSVQSVVLAPDKRKVIVSGPEPTAIPDGVLLNLLVYAHPTADTQPCLIKLSNVVGTRIDGTATAIPTIATSVAVESIVGQDGSALRVTSVVNRSSLLSGPVAPGEIVRVVGPGIGPDIPLQPGGTITSFALGDWTVLFDGTAAPLLSASANQINLIVPYNVFGKSTTRMQIRAGDRLAGEIDLSVATAAPGISTVDSSGIGPGAILNEDGSLNSPSNPAAPGTTVTIFGTGHGQTDPPGLDGSMATATPLQKTFLPVTAQIGGRTAEVVFAGAAPGLVSGADAVVARIPATIAPTLTASVALSAGNATSQPGVTVSVGPRSNTQGGSGGEGPAPVTSHQVSLTWVASISPNITGYTVYRATTADGPYSPLTADLIAETGYVDTLVESGKTYYYVVTASDADNNVSDYSEEVQAVIPG